MLIENLRTVDLLVLSYLKRRQFPESANSFAREAKLHRKVTSIEHTVRDKHLDEIVNDFIKFGDTTNAAGHLHYATRFFALAMEYNECFKAANIPSSSSSSTETVDFSRAASTPSIQQISLSEHPMPSKRKRLPLHARPHLQNLTYHEAQNVPPVVVNPPPGQVNKQGQVDISRNESVNQVPSNSSLFTESISDNLDDSREGFKKQNRRFLSHPVRTDDKMVGLSTKIAKIANTIQDDCYDFETEEDVLRELSAFVNSFDVHEPEPQSEESRFEYHSTETLEKPPPILENVENNFLVQYETMETDSTNNEQLPQHTLSDSLETPPSTLDLSHSTNQPVDSSSKTSATEATEEPVTRPTSHTVLSPKKEAKVTVEAEGNPTIVTKENPENPQSSPIALIKPKRAENMFKPRKRKIDMSNAYAVLDQIHSNK